MPDRQGWTGFDRSAPEDSVHFHLDTFHCANLDPDEVENHAWWCGAYFDDCSNGDGTEGYGSWWEDYLDWHGTVPDPSRSVTVRVTAVLNIDVEPGEDYLYLYSAPPQPQEPVVHLTLSGKRDFLLVDETFVMEPGAFSGPLSDQVHLRWLLYSDGAWDSFDCRWPNHGAVQIDRIRVTFDQGSGPVQIGALETCEPGEPLQWEAVLASGAGDFSKVWPLLDDDDPDQDNTTPQFAFIDDGVVVPGTGGTPCTVWCYGPGGYTTNYTGGVSNPFEPRSLFNEVRSPAIPVPDAVLQAQGHAGVEVVTWFDFDVYRHETSETGSAFMLYYWRARSTSDPADEAAWSDWSSGQYATGGPEYFHHHQDISALVGGEYVQVALGVFNYIWTGTIASPAPYYDNVSLSYELDWPSEALVPAPVITLDAPTPNPFNPSTELVISIAEAGPVELRVYDLSGRLVRTLLEGPQEPGRQRVRWDGCNEKGEASAVGAYLFTLTGAGERVTHKGSLIK